MAKSHAFKTSYVNIANGKWCVFFVCIQSKGFEMITMKKSGSHDAIQTYQSIQIANKSVEWFLFVAVFVCVCVQVEMIDSKAP